MISPFIHNKQDYRLQLNRFENRCFTIVSKKKTQNNMKKIKNHWANEIWDLMLCSEFRYIVYKTNSKKTGNIFN